MFTQLYKKCLELGWPHKSSKYYLAIVSFIESSFFPIPPDVMIIPMIIAKKKEYLKIFPNNNNIFSFGWYFWLFHRSIYFLIWSNEYSNEFLWL